MKFILDFRKTAFFFPKNIHDYYCESLVMQGSQIRNKDHKIKQKQDRLKSVDTNIYIEII